MKRITIALLVFAALFAISGKLSYSQTTDTPIPIAPKVCIVSGETIEEGQGVDFKYLDKTYSFCCKHCVAKFKSEPMNYIKDELKCPVSGEGASKEKFAVVDGVKYYFCCEHCQAKFEKEPDKFLKKDNGKQ